MKKDDVTRMAKEAGLHIATDVNWMPIINLEHAEKFAATVLANHPPQSFMSWQEGYAAGAAAEREACAQICDTTPPYPFRPSIEAAHAIRARGQS